MTGEGENNRSGKGPLTDFSLPSSILLGRTDLSAPESRDFQGTFLVPPGATTESLPRQMQPERAQKPQETRACFSTSI